ncbi:MAG: dihydrofolate reductase family protein [Chloroflexota bacterium]
MSTSITQLYPQQQSNINLEGLYLSHNIRALAADGARPFVYANYIASLDGRISVPHPSGQGQMVPKTTTNERDWRLFQELVAQADVVISSGRYLRDWEDGRAQEILDVDNPKFADLRAWREAQGLKPHPDIVIISGSLNFPVPKILTAAGRKLLIFTTSTAPHKQLNRLRQETDHLYITGEQSVDGQQLVNQLKELGYQAIYNATGPKVMHLLLKANVVNRLYLTYAHRLLGGNPFASIVEGELLETAVTAQLNALYLDTAFEDNFSQLFASYDLSNQLTN